ncbi:hypothetical protein MIR68_010254 [Amoeboaphelidium protococcarum]|nr:hypothetical protein MIR68_010254 [Amoeboaphelidium protococcarum]
MDVQQQQKLQPENYSIFDGFPVVSDSSSLSPPTTLSKWKKAVDQPLLLALSRQSSEKQLEDDPQNIDSCQFAGSHLDTTMMRSEFEAMQGGGDAAGMTYEQFVQFLGATGICSFVSLNLWKFCIEHTSSYNNIVDLNDQSCKSSVRKDGLSSYDEDDQMAMKSCQTVLQWEQFDAAWRYLFKESKGDRILLLFIMICGNIADKSQTRYISAEALEQLIREVVVQHPELQFLADKPIFIDYYVQTVLTRIFFQVKRSIPPTSEDCQKYGRAVAITLKEFRLSGLFDILTHLHLMEINEEHMFFSYKHYFVLYCRFHDLDTQDCSYLSADDMTKYDGGSINSLVLERILDGIGLPYRYRESQSQSSSQSTSFRQFKLAVHSCLTSQILSNYQRDSGIDLDIDSPTDNCSQASDMEHLISVEETKHIDTSTRSQYRYKSQLTYTEFLWFMLSEEDKTSATAMEYWFRVIDLDGDGVISLYELEQFWRHQESKLYFETMMNFDFRDIVCVVLDLLQISSFSSGSEGTNSCQITLKDLRRDPVGTSKFLDHFINRKKLLERESSSGFKLYREIDDCQQTYFQQLHKVCPSPSPSSSQVNLKQAPDGCNNVSSERRQSVVNYFSTIPSDCKSSWSRWADLQYDILTSHTPSAGQNGEDINGFAYCDEDVDDNDEGDYEGYDNHQNGDEDVHAYDAAFAICNSTSTPDMIGMAAQRLKMLQSWDSDEEDTHNQLHDQFAPKPNRQNSDENVSGKYDLRHGAVSRYYLSNHLKQLSICEVDEDDVDEGIGRENDHSHLANDYHLNDDVDEDGDEEKTTKQCWSNIDLVEVHSGQGCHQFEYGRDMNVSSQEDQHLSSYLCGAYSGTLAYQFRTGRSIAALSSFQQQSCRTAEFLQDLDQPIADLSMD